MPTQCRWSPTLGELEGTHQKAWGTVDYKNDKDDTVFFGLYGLPDFYTLWRHKGKKYILWAGTDILHLQNGYWLDKIGNITIDYTDIAKWINKNCENWCENTTEQGKLKYLGITAKVCPSFMGDIKKIDFSYSPSERPKVYASVSGNEFFKYGWGAIESIAEHCDVDFYLYGNTKPWKTKHDNVNVMGRVSKETMNEQIKDMQCGLRAVKFDGFSEILAKSILMGQNPISRIKYPHIEHYESDGELINKLNKLKSKRPNIIGRNYYLNHLNKYPWNELT